MSEKVEKATRVNVDKAELSIADGETVSEFLRRLQQATEGYLFEKLGLKRDEKNHAHVWTADVFTDAVVADVSQSGPDKPYKTHLYQVPYKRTSDVEFTFGEPVEVVRRVTYVAKKKAAVSKSAGAPFWDGVL